MADTRLDIDRAIQYRITDLQGQNRSKDTLRAYRSALAALRQWIAETGLPTDVNDITREHMRMYFASLWGRDIKPGTGAHYHRLLRAFFRFLVDDGLLEASPMQGIKAPAVPITPPPVLSPDDFGRLLKTCSGSSFTDRRDKAILMMFMDTPLRRAELAGIKIEDLDMDNGRVYVTGKGNKGRYVGYGPHTAKALMRYLMERDKEPYAGSPMLWIGQRGKMSLAAVYAMVKRRAADAGLPSVFIHQFRHTFANNWLLDGGTEGDLMALGGWTSSEMMRRYGSSARSERALQSYASRSPLSRMMEKDKGSR